MNITEKVKELGLKSNEFVIVAGSAMATHGLKETKDIDLVISPEVYKRLKAEGWEEKFHDSRTSVLLRDMYDAGTTWNGMNLEKLLESADLIDGVPIANLQVVLEWKRKMNREKDQKDIAILEHYLSKNSPSGNN